MYPNSPSIGTRVDPLIWRPDNRSTEPAPRWGFFSIPILGAMDAFWARKIERALQQVARGEVRPFEEYLRENPVD